MTYLNRKKEYNTLKTNINLNQEKLRLLIDTQKSLKEKIKISYEIKNANSIEKKQQKTQSNQYFSKENRIRYLQTKINRQLKLT